MTKIKLGIESRFPKFNCSEFEKEYLKLLSSPDMAAKNAILPMYDCDTTQGMPNFIPSSEFIVRMIDGDKVYFESDFAFTDIIRSSDNYSYCYKYACVYKGKLVALGEELGRAGGTTHVLTKENNPKKIIEKLGKSDKEDDKLLYDKIKYIEIATARDMPNCPKTMYYMSDSFLNNYYINDNTNGTYTLWLVNKDKPKGEEIRTTSDFNSIFVALFNQVNLDISSLRRKIKINSKLENRK